MNITFTLVPASGKHVTKKNGMIMQRGRLRQNDACRAQELDFHRQAKNLYPFPHFSDVPYVLDLVFVFPTKDVKLHGTPKMTRPDVGNLAALLSDALEGVCYLDDAQVVEERVSKVWGERCEVHVTLEEWGSK